MFQTDAEDFVKNWLISDAKVFYYFDYWPWRQKETIILFRKNEDTFTTIKDKSTVVPADFTREQMIKLLASNRLEERAWESTQKNYRDEKTGGCVCGAWATSMASNPNAHWHDCPGRHKRY